MPEDTGTASAGGSEGTVEPTVQTAAAGTTTETQQATASTEPQETFPRSVVEELRKENAERRTRSKQYDETFAGYTPEQQEVLFRLVKGLNDPASQKQTAAEWKEIADKILAADGPTLPNGEPDPDARPLTKKEWEKLQEERDTRNSQANAIKEIEQEAAKLGFPPAPPGDVEGMRYSMFLSAAQHPEVAGDLTKAAAKVKEYEQGVIDAHAKALQEGGEKFPSSAGPSTNTGAAEPPEAHPTWQTARAAALKFLNARAGATE